MSVDITGKTFYFLTALKFSYRKNYKDYWLCRCECGIEKTISKDKLMYNGVKSCGCKTAMLTSAVKKIHGMSKSRFYGIWNDMMMRCYNPNKERYSCYGARGIKVCERWHTFLNFYNDMFASYQKGLSLEREKVNEDYSPNNCKWIPIKDQKLNKQKPIMLFTINGETKTVLDWCKISKLSYSGVYFRKKQGHSDYDCIFGLRKLNN